MSLAPGTRVGSYEIVSPLGAGGMGEVYRATDTHLKRAVAIKVLPATVAGDADRLARLQREAEVLAILNHPNIAHIYGYEPQANALVLELVEGRDLSSLIKEGPIAVPDALAIARQIVDALEAAHEVGVVHRDLKPGNIKIRQDGTVKVLDFGLAKVTATEVAEGKTEAPTVTSPALSQMGIILGTAAYMSPEQAKGRAVDKRADIWAFGVVLYEMLTGKRLFDAEDVTDTLAAVLTRDTTVAAIPHSIPPRLRGLIARCLVRDPKQRLRDLGDARIELDRIASGAPDNPATLADGATSSARSRLWPAAAIVFAIATAGLAFAVASRPAAPPPIVEALRFTVPVPESGPISATRVSRDGRKMVIIQSAGLQLGLHLHSFDTGTTEFLKGTDDVSPQLFAWSPSSDSFVYSAGTKLQRVSATGGPPVTIATLPTDANYTGDWGANNVLLICHAASSPIMRLALDKAGAPEVEKALDASKGELTFRWPRFLPDGRHYTFLAFDGKTWSAYVGEVGSERRWPLPGITSGSFYLPAAQGGYLVFLRSGTLVAQRFNLDRFSLEGPIEVIADEITGAGALTAPFSASSEGTVVFRGRSETRSTLVWFDRHGKSLGEASPPGGYVDIELSPNERFVAYEAQNDIWVFDLQSRVSERVTTDPARDADPVWSPDGKEIAFRADRDGGHIYARAFGAVGKDRILLKDATRDSPSSWSRDGKYIAYDSGGATLALPLGPNGDAKAIATSGGEPAAESQISPDGHWIAYHVGAASKMEVFVQSFPQPGAKRKVSTSGGRTPRWSYDGRELYFIAGTGDVMAAPISTAGGTINPGAPVKLFTSSIVPNGEGQYVVTKDGRFLINVRRSDNGITPVTVIRNWAARR